MKRTMFGDPAGLLHPGMVLISDPRISAAVAVWPAANRGIYARVMFGGLQISKIALEVGTSSGNISLAVYRNSGTGQAAVPTGAPVVTTGAIACPATGYAEVAITPVTVAAGDWLFMSCDNTTATIGRWAHPTGVNTLLGLVRRQDTAHPAPTVGTLAASSTTPLLVGLP